MKMTDSFDSDCDSQVVLSIKLRKKTMYSNCNIRMIDFSITLLNTQLETSEETLFSQINF